jgi:hypothetical protein
MISYNLGIVGKSAEYFIFITCPTGKTIVSEDELFGRPGR